jgi:poly(3-hydroxybutyrate) depolymerase
MKREIIFFIPAVLGLCWFVASSHFAQESHTVKKLQLPKELAQRLKVAVEPVGPGRYYNHSNGDEGSPTVPWLLIRRAFCPSETVTLRFRLPDDFQVASAVSLKVAVTLHDITGKKLQDVGETLVQASPSQVQGKVQWTVPVVNEGEYFLAGRFSNSEGKWLMTHSDIVFVTPEYPRLRALAEKAIQVATRKLGSQDSDLRNISLPSVEMLLEDAERRWCDFGQAHRDWSFVKKTLEEARSSAEKLAAGADPYLDKTGVLIKAFRSNLDDTLQPYAVYIPRNYTRSRTYPMLVSLHGATSNHRINMRRVFGFGNQPGESDYEATRNEVELPQVDFIVVSPYGRGETAGYNGIAEQDVLRVMADVQKSYNIDPDRVYLTGLSMGGGGTWHIGLRYPDKFAAIVPVCGVADVDISLKHSAPSKYDQLLFSLTGPSAITENAGNLAVFIYHGDMDESVPVEASRRMAEKFKGLGWLGENVHYYELPGVKHSVWDLSYRDGNIFKILSPIRRSLFPKRVVYSTFSPRYNKAYWLRIDRIEKGLELARIEGTLQGYSFSIRTKNISAFSILLDPRLVPSGEKIQVDHEGKAVYSGIPDSQALSFSQLPDGTFVEKKWEGKSLGPPDHMEAGYRNRTIVQADRHLYVYGTGGDTDTQKASKALAEKLADWGPEIKVRWKVVADTDVGQAEMENNNLVLVGNAMINRIVARMKEKLPIKEKGDGLKAADLIASGKDVGYRLICSNPLAPGRLVFIHGAGTVAGLKNLDRLVRPSWSSARNADYLRYGTGADYLLLDSRGDLLAAGLFKDRWEIGK